MTRARIKAIHAKVNSLLSMCDIDTPLNGLLLHSDTLCVLSYGGPEDPYEDGQEATQEDGQESNQYDEEEEEKKGEETPGGGTTGQAVLPPLAQSARPHPTPAVPPAAPAAVPTWYRGHGMK